MIQRPHIRTLLYGWVLLFVYEIDRWMVETSFVFYCHRLIFVVSYKLNLQYWQFVQRAPVDFAITEPLSVNEAPPVIEAIWEVSEWSTCSHSCAGGKKGSDSCFLAYFRWSWRWKRRRHARPTKPHPRYLSTSRHCLKIYLSSEFSFLLFLYVIFLKVFRHEVWNVL